jgi:hypothetical protein
MGISHYRDACVFNNDHSAENELLDLRKRCTILLLALIMEALRGLNK